MMVSRHVEPPGDVYVGLVIDHVRPHDPQISPDGSSVVFMLRRASRPESHPAGAIWIVDSESGELRQFTGGDGLDTAACWSPDGRSIAFCSDRDARGEFGLYVLSLRGGEAIRSSDLCGEFQSLSWSPDGTRLAVLHSESDQHEYDDEKRRDPHVRDTDYTFQRLWVIDQTTGSAQCVSPPDRQVWHYAWSPDSSRLALNLTDTPLADEMFKQTEIVTLAADGSDPRLVCRKTGVAGNIVWSADGSHLALLHSPGRVITGDSVYKVTIASGEMICLMPGYHGTVESFAAVDNGSQLLVTCAEGFGSGVYRLTWDGALSPIIPADAGAITSPVSVSASGTRIAMVREDGKNPPDIWIAQSGAGGSNGLSRRTRLNPDLDSMALARREIVRWQSDVGVEIEGLLLRPPGPDSGQALPLVVQVHGGPTARWSDRFLASWHDWAQLLASRGFAVLLPNPRGSTGRGSEFSNAIFADVGGGEFRDILSGADAMIERGIADPDRLGIGGWSWGGYLTAWTITQTTRFKAAVVGAGPANLISDNSLSDIPSGHLSYFEQLVYKDPEPYWDRSPMKYLHRVRTPTLILHGEADRRVACAQGVELYTGLRALGVETQLVTYPREGHEIEERDHQRDVLERVGEWFARHLTL